MYKKYRKNKILPEKSLVVPCPHCRKIIKKDASKCHYCGSTLDRFGVLERPFIPNIASIILTVATCLSAIFAFLSYDSAQVSRQERNEIEEIKAQINKANSDLNYYYLFNLYQKMEASAEDWRRCKFLQQSDCDLLSLGFLYDAENTLNAFFERKIKMDEKALSAIQQFMCVGLSVTLNDGQTRGLFDSIKDHKEANVKEHITDFLKNCPKYIIEKEPVFKVEKNNN